MKPLCSECSKKESWTRGLCNSCYHKQWRHKKLPKIVRQICSVEGCEEPFYCKDYCKQHYGRWYYQYKKGEDFVPKKKKIIIKKTCKMCGVQLPLRRISYCSKKCYNKKAMGYQKLSPENLQNYRSEAMILLTKWKWRLIEPILFYRIVNLYIELFGLTFTVQRINKPYVTCEECLKQIQKAYGF